MGKRRAGAGEAGSRRRGDSRARPASRPASPPAPRAPRPSSAPTCAARRRCPQQQQQHQQQRRGQQRGARAERATRFPAGVDIHAGWAPVGARRDARGCGLGPGSGLSGAGTTSGSHGEQALARSLCGSGSPGRVCGCARPQAGGLDLGPRGGRDPARRARSRLLQLLQLLLASPGRRRPATRSPWALCSSEVLHQPPGRGVRTSPWAPSTFFPGSSLPLSWKAPAAAVDPKRLQQIRARRWARPGRPPPPTGRRGRGGGDSGRVAARKGLARGGSRRGAGAAPLMSRRARAEGRGGGLGA